MSFLPSSHIRLILAAVVSAVLLTRVGAEGSGNPAVRRIRIENRLGGNIGVSRDGGVTYQILGHVIRPIRGELKDIQDKEFTASDWGSLGAVVATAVNAIHFKVGQKAHATIFSIQPQEFLKVDESYSDVSYFHIKSSIYTDIPAGTGLFGEESPYVGDRLYLETEGSWVDYPVGRAPVLGDVLSIENRGPESDVERVEFENCFGGRIVAFGKTGIPRTVGQVLRPVTGVGRFAGSKYAGVGEIRANHPGVICISTSPWDEIGGLQIVPARHASEPDLNYVRTKSVWMVVGPASVILPDLEGQTPLFRGHFRPRQGKVEVRLDAGPWQLIPEAVGLQETALLHVSHLRILVD